MSGVKFFNFVMPVESYKRLKTLSNRTGKPIAEMLRDGIGLVLKNEKAGKQDTADQTGLV